MFTHPDLGSRLDELTPKEEGMSLCKRPTLLLGAAITILSAAGCGRKADSADREPVAAETTVETKQAKAETLSKDERHRLSQKFADAVLLEPPADDELRPPDLTASGKNVAKLFEAVAGKDNKGGLWDQIQLVDAKSKPIKYLAVMTTPLGEIQIELYPEYAPNHVRSFMALAKAGYFDGLPIYGSVRETDADMLVNAYIESGCPKGTGEVGYGSIGYWLKPEIEGNKLTHEAGAVGAWHREERETAACRFYITAEKMPHMDGSFTVFGKVVRGLDLVRTINARPVEDKTTNRLKEPVPIQSVVIQTPEEAAPVVQAN
jgi:cyclophilin family peptidyl-prolyl cis-trans isomerase